MKSCWTCAKFVCGGVFFPGRCAGFKKAGEKLEPREIPLEMVDQGCKFYERREDDKAKGPDNAE